MNFIAWKKRTCYFNSTNVFLKHGGMAMVKQRILFFILHVLFTTLVIQLKFGKSSLSHTESYPNPRRKKKQRQAPLFLSWSSFVPFCEGVFHTTWGKKRNAISPQERLDKRHNRHLPMVSRIDLIRRIRWRWMATLLSRPSLHDHCDQLGWCFGMMF